MKNIFIAIGGSGTKVAEALVRLVACGQPTIKRRQNSWCASTARCLRRNCAQQRPYGQRKSTYGATSGGMRLTSGRVLRCKENGIKKIESKVILFCRDSNFDI